MIAAILAGGTSRRMGRDKALLEVDGISMLERACRAAANVGLPAVVIGRRPSLLPVTMRHDFDAIADDTPDQGPLGGLATAMRHYPDMDILLSACDLPQVNAQHFMWLRNTTHLHGERSPAGIIPTHEDISQPLFAIYRPALFPAIQKLLSLNQRAMRNLLSAADFHYLELPSHLTQAILDADTEEDLQRFR